MAAAGQVLNIELVTKTNSREMRECAPGKAAAASDRLARVSWRPPGTGPANVRVSLYGGCQGLRGQEKKRGKTALGGGLSCRGVRRV